VKRSAVPLVIAASVAATIGAGAGAAEFLGRSSGSVYVSAAGEPSPASDAVQAKANRVWDSFDGTVAQRNAAGVLQAWKLNGAMDTCMAEKGFPEWDWSQVRNMAPRTNALATSTFFGAPLSHGYSASLMDTAAGVRAEYLFRVTSPNEKTGSAIDACLDETPPVSDDDADEAAVPAAVRGLRDQWWAMLSRLDAKYGDRKEHSTCFAEQAVTIAGTSGALTADTWEIQLSHLVPPSDLIPDSAASPLVTGTRWAQFVAVEGDLEQADWTCRRSVYEEHLADVSAAIDAFAVEHQTQIAKAGDGWAKIEQRAAELGYHGQAGAITR